MTAFPRSHLAATGQSRPRPLPEIREDPSITGALDAQNAYPERVNAIRGDVMLSDLAKAEQIVAAHEALCAELARLRDDLYERRRARLNWLASRVPVGPEPDEDASAADRAVLATAFRTALAQARSVGLEERCRMLADALKYGDDMQMRGVLAAAEDDGQRSVLDEWAKATQNEELVAELRALRADIAGGATVAGGWERRAFWQPPAPAEERALIGLRRAADDATRDHARAQAHGMHGAA
ncbi:hypothetical protein [Actinomadura litoris]|uniref:Uncharacterized protein n=1 Tax=Actinomadura litoris TaxID=2678616 RepID=A0A7K1L3J8_9ACTN|nr:hypothetical protein [Actinomadura litoris]MUN38989.1 hypothetical protein [Actinomadura litoris]